MTDFFKQFNANYMSNKKLYNKFILCNFFIVFLVAILVTCSFTINYNIDKFEARNIIPKNIEIKAGSDSVCDENFTNKLKQIKEVEKINFIGKKTTSNFYVNETNFKYENVSFNFCSQISQEDIRFFNTNYPKEDLFVAGKMHENEDEFIANERFIRYMGIENLETAIGDYFDFHNGARLRLVGIVNDSLVNNNFNVFMNKSNMEYFDDVQCYYNVYLNKYISSDYVIENIKKILPKDYAISNYPSSPEIVLFNGTNIKLETYKSSVLYCAILIDSIIILILLGFSIKHLCEIIKIDYDKDIPQGKRSLFTLFIMLAIIFANLILSIALLYIYNAVVIGLISSTVMVNFNVYGIAIGFEILIAGVLYGIYALIALIEKKKKFKMEIMKEVEERSFNEEKVNDKENINKEIILENKEPIIEIDKENIIIEEDKEDNENLNKETK